MKLIKPKSLSEGDTIGIVAPSFFIEKEAEFRLGVSNLEEMGFKIKYGKHVFTKYRNTTGLSKDRADDIMSMFTDNEVKGIIASDGGCTAIEVLDKLDYKTISQNPKVFSGFSDIAHLNLAFFANSKLSTLYGLDIINGFGVEKSSEVYNYNVDFFMKLVTGTEIIGVLPKFSQWESWRDGIASGHLVGGWIDAVANMTHISALLDFDNIILFWESIDLQPHNLNMLLNAMKVSGLFNKVRGMIIGNFVDCEEKEYWDCTPTVKQIVLEVTESMNIPILANVDFGHSVRHLSLPQGLTASIDSNSGIINIKESYCE